MFIVINARGQPLKLGGFKFACEAIAVPVDVEDATQFKSRDKADRAAKRMMNLNNYQVMELVPLDQQ